MRKTVFEPRLPTPKKEVPTRGDPPVPQIASGPVALLWPLSNKNFLPASEQFISIYAWFDVALTLLTGARYILEYSIFEPGWHGENAGALFVEALFEMIVEIVTAVFLIQGANIISRLVERRHDVLHYVSNSDPRLINLEHRHQA